MQEVPALQWFLAWGGIKIGDRPLQSLVDTGQVPQWDTDCQNAMCLKSLTVTELESQIAENKNEI
jgi:hypothetical protein